MAKTPNGEDVPGGPKAMAAWFLFTSCRLVGYMDRKEIIEMGVKVGHNRGQLETEWSRWLRACDKVHAPFVDKGELNGQA